MTFSIRDKIFTSIAVMLFPIVLMAGTGYVVFERMLAAFDRVIAETRNEMIPVYELRYLMAQSAMPPNDYLIHGHVSERTEYEQVSQQVDKVIDSLLTTPTILSEQQVILERVKLRWEKNKLLAKEILAFVKPVGNNRAAMAMEKYDRDIGEISTQLEQIDNIIHAELDEYTISFLHQRRNLMMISALVFATSILVVIFAGTYLTRKILFPLRKLQLGASNLGAGDLRSRIELEADDEIGQLARTFNAMAEDLEKLVTRDDLTGLLNKREFDRRLTTELGRSLRYGDKLSLLMIDMDFFKKVNDNHGHQAGDKVLQVISTFIEKQLRPSDHAARYGGEELAVILPQTDLQSALVVAERIRTAIESNPIHIDNRLTIEITASIGVATCPDDANNVAALIAFADQALYSAKHKGRNQVVPFSMQTV